VRATHLCVFLLFTAVGVTAASDTGTADPNSTKPWQWTNAERAAARRDPAKRLDRVPTYEQQQRSSRIAANSAATVADVIEGDKHPELYFPTELFMVLVRSAFVTLPAGYPHVVRQRTSDLFKAKRDWDRFAVIVADYAKLLNQEATSADELDRSAISAIQSAKCTAEARAFREARWTFGRARFDRMLYETVAPGMSTTFSMDTDFGQSIATALEREQRCQ
jgi:hypothetical protein